ncbi:MAG: divalent-cation tolerance protein CutA [candidate division Zixibacteria bacterium]|nr:divalent-cation tolerance protein CutA [candidate division Zixibacteria bacterium]
MSAFRVAFITVQKDKAEKLSRELIENKLAACVNIINSVQSIYRLKGTVIKDEEALLIVKTATKKVESLIKFVKENHSYEIPEVISLNIVEGNPDYLDWVDEETK